MNDHTEDIKSTSLLSIIGYCLILILNFSCTSVEEHKFAVIDIGENEVFLVEKKKEFVNSKEIELLGHVDFPFVLTLLQPPYDGNWSYDYTFNGLNGKEVIEGEWYSDMKLDYKPQISGNGKPGGNNHLEIIVRLR